MFSGIQNRTLSIALAAALGVMAGSAPATATTITFDDPPLDTCASPYTNGLVFSSGACLGAWAGNPVSNNGTPALIYGGTMTVQQFDGGAFHLQSFLAGISWYSSAVTADINYSFDLAAGGTSTGTFTIGRGFQSFTFDADITNATFTGLPDGYVAVDNLQGDFATPNVPEPATWAMMLGGFGAVGGALRVRRKPVRPSPDHLPLTDGNAAAPWASGVPRS